MASAPVNSTLAPPARPRRRWYQFTLRTVGVWMILLCLLLGSFAWWRDRAERQRKVVEELRGLGASVDYRYFSRTKQNGLLDESVWNHDEFFPCYWLRRRFGVDFVYAVAAVSLTNPHHSAALPPATTRLGLRLLQRCPHIKQLVLEGNAVNGADLEQLPFIESLEGLSLVARENGPRGLLTDDDLAMIGRATCLQSLILERQPIGDRGIEHLRNCRQLQLLSLSETDVGDEGLQHVSELTELVDLDLRHTRVTDKGLKHLSNLRKLVNLMLGGNALSGDGLAVVGSKPELSFLDVRDTEFADAALRHLEQFPKLDLLDLKGTKVNGSGTKQFQARHPGCLVRY